MQHCNNSRCPKHPSASSIFWSHPTGVFSLPTWTSSDFFRVKTWRHCNAKKGGASSTLRFQYSEWVEFVGVIPNHTIYQSSNHPIIQSSIFFGVHRVHPGRLTCFPYKSPMKRKENDLFQASMILFHVKPMKKSYNLSIIRSSNHAIIQFLEEVSYPNHPNHLQPSWEICRGSHTLASSAKVMATIQPNPTRAGQVGLNRRLPRDACALPSKYDMLMLLMDD